MPVIAGGRSLLEISEPIVGKDIQLPSLQVDSYASRPRVYPCPIVRRTIPLATLARVAADAVCPYLSGPERRHQNFQSVRQLLLFTYLFWLVEYRVVESWRYAVGISLGMRPKYSASGIEMTRSGRLLVWFCYAVSSLAGLLVPK